MAGSGDGHAEAAVSGKRGHTEVGFLGDFIQISIGVGPAPAIGAAEDTGTEGVEFAGVGVIRKGRESAVADDFGDYALLELFALGGFEDL